MAAKITHKRLVTAAKMWLQARCKTVATELAGVHSEIPDSIGWKPNGESLLIECKASRADFLSDKNKLRARLDIGMGRLRWYMAPPEIIKESDLPAKWGLLEYRPSKHQSGYYIKEIVKPVRRLDEDFDRPNYMEKMFLITIAKRALEALRLVKPLAYGLEEE